MVAQISAEGASPGAGCGHLAIIRQGDPVTWPTRSRHAMATAPCSMQESLVHNASWRTRKRSRLCTVPRAPAGLAQASTGVNVLCP